MTLLATDGHFLHGAGPVNEAMGGADTGICLDAAGSISWNPACSTEFKGHRFEFYGTLFVPWRSLSSTVDAGAFGPMGPEATLSGTTVSKRDMSVMPGIAFIYHPQGSKNAYHVAMLAVSGFGVDYAENTDFSNPILTPQAPNGYGFGRIRSNYMLLTVPVGFSHQLSDKLSVGLSLTPSMSMLQVIPAPFASPVTAGNNGYPYYLSAGNNAPAFGSGIQGGVHYKVNDVLSLGAGYRSPVWFTNFKWNRADLTGAKHIMTFRMNLPQVVSIGAGITASKTTKIGFDVRWFNYEETKGFDKEGYTAAGAVAGFGWQNIWAFGGGIQQQVAKSTKAIVGYNYSQNPVPASLTFFNTPAPAIVQHHLSGGVVQTVGTLDLNLTYYHAFQNSITGPWISGMGAMPGTSATSAMHENSLTIGFSKSF